MFVPDLHQFPPGHPPSPDQSPPWMPAVGGSEYGYLPEGVVVRAVGWIGTEVYAVGDTPEVCIQRLFNAHGSVVSDGSQGWHECEANWDGVQHGPRIHESGERNPPVVRRNGREIRLCGHGHYIVRLGDVAYVAPELLLHYIVDHEYRPPDEFVRAVIEGTFLTFADLVVKLTSTPRRRSPANSSRPLGYSVENRFEGLSSVPLRREHESPRGETAAKRQAREVDAGAERVFQPRLV